MSVKAKSKWGMIVTTAAAALTFGCSGDDNIADCEKGKSQVPCSERTADEEARLALDAEDWDTAILLLEEARVEEPEVYGRFPLLAAAYAARAGFDIFAFAKAGGTGEGSGSAVDVINAFLPDPATTPADVYEVYVGDMNSAVTVLKAIPEALLGETSAEKYGKSALLQLTLYQSSYAFMYLQKFTISATGDVSLENLDNMSEDEALAVLESLTDVTQLPQAEGNAEVQGKVAEALAAIEDEDGATKKEKLKAYMEANKAEGK